MQCNSFKMKVSVVGLPKIQHGRNITRARIQWCKNVVIGMRNLTGMVVVGEMGDKSESNCFLS